MMMIEPILAIREAIPSDHDTLTAFVQRQAGATPFHLPAWTAAVAEGCGQRDRTLIALAGDGAIAGMIPLTEVHSPLFGRALVSSGYAVGGGALAERASTAGRLIEAAWRLAGALSCGSLELRGGAMPPTFAIDSTTYAGFVRDLAADDGAELLAIPRKQRAEVRRALGLGLTVSVGRDEHDRAAHYAVYAESVRNLGTPVFPQRLFDAVLDRFGERADILTIAHDGVAIASVLSLYFGGTVLPYWGGGTRAARELRANDLLYFALMRHARERGCTRFDFGRSKAGTGAFAFKRNWGFAPSPLAYGVRTMEGAEARSVNPLDPRYRMKIEAWKRLPLPLANRIGPLIARGLG